MNTVPTILRTIPLDIGEPTFEVDTTETDSFRADDVGDFDRWLIQRNGPSAEGGPLSANITQDILVSITEIEVQAPRILLLGENVHLTVDDARAVAKMLCELADQLESALQ